MRRGKSLGEGLRSFGACLYVSGRILTFISQSHGNTARNTPLGICLPNIIILVLRLKRALPMQMDTIGEKATEKSVQETLWGIKPTRYSKGPGSLYGPEGTFLPD